jgi:hypothetical protein
MEKKHGKWTRSWTRESEESEEETAPSTWYCGKAIPNGKRRGSPPVDYEQLKKPWMRSSDFRAIRKTQRTESCLKKGRM